MTERDTADESPVDGTLASHWAVGEHVVWYQSLSPYGGTPYWNAKVTKIGAKQVQIETEDGHRRWVKPTSLQPGPGGPERLTERSRCPESFAQVTVPESVNAMECWGCGLRVPVVEHEHPLYGPSHMLAEHAEPEPEAMTERACPNCEDHRRVAEAEKLARREADYLLEGVPGVLGALESRFGSLPSYARELLSEVHEYFRDHRDARKGRKP